MTCCHLPPHRRGTLARQALTAAISCRINTRCRSTLPPHKILNRKCALQCYCTQITSMILSKHKQPTSCCSKQRTTHLPPHWRGRVNPRQASVDRSHLLLQLPHQHALPPSEQSKQRCSAMPLECRIIILLITHQHTSCCSQKRTTHLPPHWRR